MLSLSTPPLYAPLGELLRQLVAQLPVYRNIATAFDDAVWVGGRLAETLPLPVALKQSLLETPDALARLERIAVALKSGKEGA